MSFPHLDRCSCGSPTSNRDGNKPKQNNLPDVGASLHSSNKNDYRIGPAKRQTTATSNNSSNDSGKILSARSQPSLRDENFKNFLTNLDKPVQGRRRVNVKMTCSEEVDKVQQGSIREENIHGNRSTNNATNIAEKQIKIGPEVKPANISQTTSTLYESKKTGLEPNQKDKLMACSAMASNGKPSNVPGKSNQETQQTSAVAAVGGRKESGNQPSRNQRADTCQQSSSNENSNTEYTPLTYDANYVKVSPPRLTRRPKKSDDNASEGASGPVTRAQQLLGKQSWEDKHSQKRTLKAPPQTPPNDKSSRDKSRKSLNVSINRGTGTSPDASVIGESSGQSGGDSPSVPTQTDEDEVLELTFTVLLERGTLKKVNKSQVEDGGSARIKLKTDNMVLDANSKRLVAQSITEALRENTNLGNVSLVERGTSAAADDANARGEDAFESPDAKRSMISYIGMAGGKDLNYNCILKSPVHDRSSYVSKSFDGSDTTKTKPQEVLTSYQSLDRKHTFQKDRMVLEKIKESGHSTAERDESFGKKYQALNNFSPLHDRLAASAIIHGPSAQGSTYNAMRDQRRIRLASSHCRYDSDTCDYETKENKLQRYFSKPLFNNNNNIICNNNSKGWSKNKYSSYGSRISKGNGIASEEEITHMNWDDLMKEAKCLGIPLKRPDKVALEADKEVFKFPQNNLTNRFLKSFSSKKAGLKLTKSICGGELGRSRDEYFNDLCSASYQCTYEAKKISPFKEKFRFMNILLGRTKSSKNLNDDCPLCRQQQQQNLLNRGKNLIKRSVSTNRGICLKQSSNVKHPKCTKDQCYSCNCSCYCSYKGRFEPDNKVYRSNSSPPVPPASLKQNSCRKISTNAKCYDVCCREFQGSKNPKSGCKKIFDSFSLSDNYRSLLSPKKTLFKNKTESVCCQPYTPQNHHRQFKHLHLNSCGDDGGYDDDNDGDDNRDEVFLDDAEAVDKKGTNCRQNPKKVSPTSAGLDVPDYSGKTSALNPDQNISPSASKADQNNSSGFLRSLQQLKDKGWYWGHMTFEKAEERLFNMNDGSFLVRDSSDDRYILSVSFRSQGKTHHTRIEHTQGVFSFYFQRIGGPGSDAISDSNSSTSIVDFIEDAVSRSLQGENLYYLRESNDFTSNPTPVKLLYPVSRFSVPTLKDSCLSLLSDVAA